MRIVIIITIVFVFNLSNLGAIIQTWQALYDSAGSYIQNEDYLTALPIAENALEQADIEFGTLDSNYSKTIAILADINLKLDNYDTALQYATLDSSLKNKIYSTNSKEYANSIFKIAAIQLKKNNYTDVDKLIRIGFDKLSGFVLRDSNKTTIRGISDRLIYLLPMLGPDAEREDGVFFDERVLKLSIELIKNKFGENNWGYGWSHRWLGKYYHYNHRYNEAIEVLKAFLKLFLKKEGDSTTFVKEGYQAYLNYILSSIYFNNANLCYIIGNCNEAVNLFINAIELIKKAYGRNSYFYYRYTFNLAKSYIALNRFDEADSLLLKVIKNDLMRIQYAFSNLSSSERIAFLKDLKKDYDYFSWYVLSIRYKTNPVLLQELYNYNLTFKGLLLYKSKNLHDFICSTDDEETKRKYIELERKTNLLSKIYHASQNPNSRINTDTLEQSINNSERELSLSCPLMFQYNQSKNLSWKDIQFTLKDNEAAVEIIRFRHFGKVPNKYKPDVMEPGFTDSVSYAVLIIKKGLKSPDYVLIENGNELESASYKKYIYAMNPQDSIINNYIEYKKYLKKQPGILNELRDVYWSKIQEKFFGINQVYLSADGIYNKINLNTLNSNNNKENLPDIYLLSSTKDLAESVNQNNSKNKTAILFGNPNYNFRMDGQNQLVLNNEKKDDKSCVSLKRTKDGYLWNPLPATENEVKSIENKFTSNGWQVKTFIKDSSVEHTIKEIESPKVLHIATHGYFDEDLNAKEDDYSILNNPLLRSGLVMAGANDIIKSFENNSNPDLLQFTDDGLLTAYEIMNMNLNNTDLVVLSACETGLGDVMNGEGVFGLQRAFLV